MAMKDVDVLICGAGASGLTLAIELARRSTSFQIIEKLSGPFAGSKGKGLQPRSLEIMEDLGLVDKIYAQGMTHFTLRRYEEDGRYEDVPAQESFAKDSSEPYGATVLIPQYSTEVIFRDRLLELGERVHFGCELLSFKDEGEHVLCEIRSSKGVQTLRAKYLIGCDGGKSFVRKALGLKFEGDFLEAPPMVAADVECEGVSRDVWHRWNSRNKEKYFAIAPLPSQSLYQLQAAIPELSDDYLHKEKLTALARERTGDHKITITKVTWSSTVRFSARLAEHYSKGRVFLCGDAAHVHPPTGGQGLNTSLQDAYNFAWKLSAVLKGGPKSLLDSYEAERRPIAEGMIELSTGIMKSMKFQRGRETQQLDLAYEDSPLSFSYGKGEGRPIAAGNRAPDAKLRGAGGQTRRVFDLLLGTHFTLLTQDSEHPEPRPNLHIHTIGEGAEFRDEFSEFKNYYGLREGEGILIRPDGYVAALYSKDKRSEFESYLEILGLQV